MKVAVKKPIDCFVLKVKAKDYEYFKENALSSLLLTKMFRNKPDIFIIENPKFRTYKEGIENMQASDWAVLTLKNKGFNVKSPKLWNKGKITNPEDIIHFYVLKTSKIREAYNESLSGFRAKVHHKIDLLKTVFSVKKLFSTFQNKRITDSFDKDAVDFLTNHEMNKYSTKRFEKFVNKFNVREIEYTPRTS